MLGDPTIAFQITSNIVLISLKADRLQSFTILLHRNQDIPDHKRNEILISATPPPSQTHFADDGGKLHPDGNKFLQSQFPALNLLPSLYFGAFSLMICSARQDDTPPEPK